MKVHLDTDIGGDIDDLCALALLLKWPDVEITGITTVLEHDGRRAGYARFALALAGRSDVPVAAGADLRLGCFQLGAGLPDEEQYWPEPVAPMPGRIEAALDLLKHSIDAQAMVIGIGPFTNLSLLERRYPGTLEHANVCLMGGYVRPAPPGFPAWDFTDDYNVQSDPTAARHVLESAHPVLVPIEVTVQTALRRAHVAVLGRSHGLGQLLVRQAEAHAREYRNDGRYGACAGVVDDIINFQHDPLACAVALGWDGVTIEPLGLRFESDADWLRMRIDSAARPLSVVTAVDGERFNALWLETVAD